MKENSLHIHWYPGHIAKAERQLKEKLKLVDVVIEVRDARLPLSSSYKDIKKLLGEKPKLLLLNKADLVDIEELKLWVNYLKTSLNCPVIPTMSTNNNSIQQIIKSNPEG